MNVTVTYAGRDWQWQKSDINGNPFWKTDKGNVVTSPTLKKKLNRIMIDALGDFAVGEYSKMDTSGSVSCDDCGAWVDERSITFAKMTDGLAERFPMVRTPDHLGNPAPVLAFCSSCECDYRLDDDGNIECHIDDYPPTRVGPIHFRTREEIASSGVGVLEEYLKKEGE